MRVQHGAEDPDAAERAAVVVRARNPLRVGAGFDAAPRDLEAARRDVREVKRSGVGQQRQVDVRRDLAASAARRARSISVKTSSLHAAADSSTQLIAP